MVRVCARFRFHLLHCSQEDFKTHELPLARIKKIMRLEDDIAEAGAPRFMIAAEAPIIIAKACEIFILEVWESVWGGVRGIRVKRE